MYESQRMDALLQETVASQKKQLAQMARMLEIQQQEHAQTEHQLAQTQAALLAAAKQLGEGGQRFAGEALKAIQTEGGHAMARGLEQPFDSARQRIEQTVQNMDRSAQAISKQLNALSMAQRTLIWKSLLWLGLGGLFLAGGCSLWSWHQWKQAQRYSVEADLGRRISEADLMKCGEGLCANVDLKAQRQGENQQYRPVKPRSQ